MGATTGAPSRAPAHADGFPLVWRPSIAMRHSPFPRMSVVDQYASDGASGSQGDWLLRPHGWTMCSRQISMKILS